MERETEGGRERLRTIVLFYEPQRERCRHTEGTHTPFRSPSECRPAVCRRRILWPMASSLARVIGMLIAPAWWYPAVPAPLNGRHELWAVAQPHCFAPHRLLKCLTEQTAHNSSERLTQRWGRGRWGIDRGDWIYHGHIAAMRGSAETHCANSSSLWAMCPS